MTKVAIYAMVRVFFDLVGEPQWWWGAALLVIGGATAPLASSMRSWQRDLKTLLAYSTIENIGIVVGGLGLALAFKADGLLGLATVALIAALFHALNHAIFQEPAVSWRRRGARRDRRARLGAAGGLIHRLPVTAVCVLIERPRSRAAAAQRLRGRNG